MVVRTTALVTAIAALSGAVICFATPAAPKSGVNRGELLSPYTPIHVTGKDKGTNTCPVCQYPFNPAVQAWINTDDKTNVSALIKALERDMHVNAGKKLKAFVVFVNPRHEQDAVIAAQLRKLASENHVKDVALVYLPGPQDEAVKDYAINTMPQVKNTIFVYKQRKVESKFVNLTADAKGIAALNAAIKTVVE